MQKKVKLQNKYTRQELLAAMSERSWSAGVPFEAKLGVTPIIAFPALDAKHQVQILVADGSPLRAAFQVDTVYVTYGSEACGVLEAGVRNAVERAALGGLSDVFALFSPNKKKVKEQVLKLVEELNGSML